MNEDRVFISYASEDRPRVLEYVQALEDVGLRVWIDHDQISLSDSIVQKINDALEMSLFAVVFFSSNYARKVWTKEECSALIFAALSQRDRRVFVVRLDGTDLPALLAHRLWDQGADPGAFAARLLQFVGRCPADVANETTATAAEPAPTLVAVADLDAASVEDVALALVPEAEAILRLRARPKTKTVTAFVPGHGDVCFELRINALSETRLDDLKSRLHICRIHNEFIKELNRDLVEGGLGTFRAAFRLKLEARLVDRDQIREEIRGDLATMVARACLHR